MAPFRLWQVLSIGIVFVTLFNTFILLSCKFSDSGCFLTSSIEQENQKHLPHIKEPLHHKTVRQIHSPRRQVDKAGEKEEPTVAAWGIFTSPIQVAEDQEKEITGRRMEEGPQATQSQHRQGYKDNGGMSYEEWRTAPPNKEMQVQGRVHDKKVKWESGKVLIAGYPRKTQAFLVIGVPSVKRQKVNYLPQTLRDLISGLSVEERKHVIIVVFITDFDPTSIKAVADETAREFGNELESGLIRVIKAHKSFYPSLSKVQRLWGDSLERVRWRSKQCLDYAFLFRYCKDLGQYYMQIEDDVTISKGYLKTIKDTIQRHKDRKWSILEFGARGFIGMMYRTEDLGKLSLFVKLYHWVWPVDLLYRQFNDFHLYGNPQWAQYRPPLVRHVGAFSSLDGQVRKLEDMRANFRTYKDNDNPPARITTSIKNTIHRTRINSPYDTDRHGIFWGSRIEKLDHVLIDFKKPVRVVKLIVESGSPDAPDDYFGAADVEYSPPTDTGECGEFTLWQEFKDKPQLLVESKHAEGTLCKCIKIVITDLRRDRKKHVRWLVIREIAVWTSRNKGPPN